MKLPVLFILCVFVFHVFFISCGEEGGTGNEPQECENTYECKDGLRCIDGICSDKCVDSSDCPINLFCIDHKCKEKQAATDEAAVSDEDDITPDETETDIEVNDENSDDDPVPCTDHTNCTEDKYCFKNFCINPYINKWRIGPVDLCVDEGEDWDTLISTEPEPYIIAYFNSKMMFQTTPPDNSYCASFENSYDTFLIPEDVLKFDVYDEDDGLDVFTGDDEIGTITITPFLVSYFRDGEITVTGVGNIKSLNVKITSVTE